MCFEIIVQEQSSVIRTPEGKLDISGFIETTEEMQKLWREHQPI
jgi:hypothetical protein